MNEKKWNQKPEETKEQEAVQLDDQELDQVGGGIDTSKAF